MRQYFDKIKALETEPEKPTLRLDKEAAGRFIKHGLVCICGMQAFQSILVRGVLT